VQSGYGSAEKIREPIVKGLVVIFRLTGIDLLLAAVRRLGYEPEKEEEEEAG
jgi:hypothetical protein